MTSLLNEALFRAGVDIETFENKWAPSVPSCFNPDTIKINTGHVMHYLRNLDRMVTTILEREDTDTDSGNPNPRSMERYLNEEAWIRTYAAIEKVLLALLSFKNIKADMVEQEGRHLRILEAFDAESNYLYQPLGIKPIPGHNTSEVQIPVARQNIDNLRKWRNWYKLQRHPAPAKMLYQTLEGLVEAFIICAQDSVLMDMYYLVRDIFWGDAWTGDGCTCHACHCDWRQFLQFKRLVSCNKDVMASLLSNPGSQLERASILDRVFSL